MFCDGYKKGQDLPVAPGAQKAEDFKVNPVGENPIALIAPQGQLASMSIVFDLEARAFSSHADQQKIMNDNLLNILIEQRLRERMLATNTPIHSVMVMPFDLLDRKQVVIDISFNASDRIQSQAFLAKELASLRDHGVGAVELSTALALFKSDLENIEADELVPLLTRYVANIPMAKPSDNHHIIEFDKQPEDILLPISNESGMFYGVSFLAEGNAKTVDDVFAEDMMLRVFSQRAITLLREKYGLGYSPTAMTITPDGSQISHLLLEINADAEKLDKVRSAMAELIGDLRSGITEEERDSAAKQLASDLKPMATNAQEMSWFMTRYLVHGYGLDAVNGQ